MADDANLRARLRAEAPVDVARLFDLAVADPATGYYGRDPSSTIGAAGDFVTAPEVSQTFGELLGLALAEAWQRAGSPAPVRVVELGPGRGTLMADLWRALGTVPALRAAAAVHLVERSQPLAALQRQALAGVEVRWHHDLTEIPDGPLLLVANEFLDALPMHQLVRTATGWAERCVGCDADGALVWTLRAAPPTLAEAAAHRFPAAPAGAIAELAPARVAVVAEAARRLARAGGLALFVDYGGIATRPVDTLQAVRRHATVDVLSGLGEADLSSAVDFLPLVEAAKVAGAAAFGPLPQARVLRALGIELRALRLAARLPAAARQTVLAGVRRLLDPQAMGEAFKVLAVAAPDWGVPAGFDPGDRR